MLAYGQERFGSIIGDAIFFKGKWEVCDISPYLLLSVDIIIAFTEEYLKILCKVSLSNGCKRLEPFVVPALHRSKETVFTYHMD